MISTSKSYYQSLKKYFSSFCHYFIVFVLFVAVFLESGNRLVRDGASTQTKIVIISFLVVFSFLLFFIPRFSFKKNDIKHFFLNCFANYKTIFFAVLFLFLLISFIFNAEKSINYKSYLELGGFLLSGYFIVSSIRFKTFCNIFCNVLFVFSAISLVFYTVLSFSNVPFFSSLFIDKNIASENYFFIYNTFGNSLKNLFYYKSRLMSVFWEPGVFASFLIIGTIMLLWVPESKKKINYVYLLVFMVCLLLTKSAAGFIILPFSILFGVSRHSKNKWVIIIFIALSAIAFIIIFVLFKDKLFTENESLATRAYSFKYNFELFLKKPIIGFGFVSGLKEYYLIAPDNITANTSTLGLLMSSYGLFGLLLFLSVIVNVFAKKNELRIFDKVFLLVCILLLTNKEDQSSIFTILLFYLYIGSREACLNYDCQK